MKHLTLLSGVLAILLVFSCPIYASYASLDGCEANADVLTCMTDDYTISSNTAAAFDNIPAGSQFAPEQSTPEEAWSAQTSIPAVQDAGIQAGASSTQSDLSDNPALFRCNRINVQSAPTFAMVETFSCHSRANTAKAARYNDIAYILSGLNNQLVTSSARSGRCKAFSYAGMPSMACPFGNFILSIDYSGSDNTRGGNTIGDNTLGGQLMRTA